MNGYDDHYEVLAEWEGANGVLWRKRRVSMFGLTGESVFGFTGEMVEAVCRPESCADRHRCGKLDIGIVGEDS